MENSQSTSLNKVRVDNITTLGSLNQINKSDLSASKRQISKTPVSAVKNGSKGNSGVVNLLSNSETDKDTKNTTLKSSLSNPRDNLLTNNKMIKKTSANFISNTLHSNYKFFSGNPINSDNYDCLIHVEESTCRDDILRLKDSPSLQKTLRCINGKNDSKLLSYNNHPIVVVNKIKKPFNLKFASEQRNKTNNIQVSNTDVKKPIKMNNSSLNVVKLIDSSCSNNSKSSTLQSNEKKNKNDKTPCYIFGKAQNILDTTKKQNLQDSVTKSRTNSSNINESNNQLIEELDFDFDELISLTSLSELYNGVEEIIEYNNHSIVVSNESKKPFNLKFASEQRNITNDIQVSNTDVKKPIRMNNSSLNVVKLIDSSCSLPADEVINIDDDININEDNTTIMKSKDSLSKAESKIFPSTASSNSKSSTLQSNEKKNILDTTIKQNLQDSVTKSRTNSSNINESNNQLIEELDFDFDELISLTSLSELYNGVEEIIEYNNHSIVVSNESKKPCNLKFASEQRNKTNDIQVSNTDVKKPIRMNNSSLNVVKLIDSSCSFPADEFINIDDDININEDNTSIMQSKDSLSKVEPKIFPSTASSSLKGNSGVVNLLSNSETDKDTKNTTLKSLLSNPIDNLLTNNKMIEKTSANFISNALHSNYKFFSGNPINSDNYDCLIHVEESTCRDDILRLKDSPSLQKTLKCINGKNDSKLLSYNNHPIVVSNESKKPFNLKFASEQRNKTNDIQVSNTDVKKPIRMNNSSLNVVKLIDSSSFPADEFINIDDDININEDNTSIMQSKDSLSKVEPKIFPSTASSSLKGNSGVVNLLSNSETDKDTKNTTLKSLLSNPIDNLLTNNKMIEKTSANFISNALHSNYKFFSGNPINSDNYDCLIHVEESTCRDDILRLKDSPSLQKTLKCINGKNDSKLLSYNNHPIVVSNESKKPFNLKFASEQRNKTNDIQVSNTDVKKPIRMNNSSLNVVKLIDSSYSLPADEVINIDDDININEDNTTIMKSKDSLSKAESKIFPSTASSNSKSSTLQSNEKKNKNDKTPWNIFGKAQNILDTTIKQNLQDSVTKSRTNSSNINESNNQLIEELDFDFDQSISLTSLSELYNGVEEIIEYNNHSIVVSNESKKPFNLKFASEQRNKTNDIQVSNTDVKKPIRMNNSSLNVVKLIDSSCSLPADEFIIIDDDININEDNTSIMQSKDSLSKVEPKIFPSTATSSLKGNSCVVNLLSNSETDKDTKNTTLKSLLSNPRDNLLTNNKMIEKTSANFISNTLHSNYKFFSGNPINSDNYDCLIHVEESTCQDDILRLKDSPSLQKTLRCINGKNDSKLLSYNNHPIVVNKIKKPFNLKFASEQRNKTNNIQVSNTDVKKPIKMNNSSLNVVKLIDSSCSLPADEVIIIDDDININEDNTTIMKSKDSLSKAESKIFPSTASSNSKSSTLQSNEKKNKNDKTPRNMFGKAQNILDTTKKQNLQDSLTKSRTNSSNINESNNQLIEELDFDFDQSISQTSLSELYNGIEEIVEMYSFDNEELNSLIECGSLDSNETEEHIDTVGMDQGDSSVSESDSTIGAFDTFAQITRVRQKSFTSKDIKDTKQSKTSNQGVNHLKESLCQSEEIYDNQRSKVSVTGIPVLQSVISDVMSQIDLDSFASLKKITPPKIPITDVVEISSDEEVTVDVPKAHPLSYKQMQTQGKEAKSYKSKEDELIQIHEIESKMYKGVSITRGSSSIKPLNIEMPPCIVLTNITSDGDRISCNKILEFKKDTAQNYNNQNIEMMTIVSNSGIVKKVNKLNESGVIQPHKITMKNANEKLIKEAKEREERKKKEDERLKQEEKEDDERKKKIEEDRKRREFEKKLLYELFERKRKKEQARKNREDNARKRKAKNERKIKELKEKMKIQERKRLEKIEEKKKKKRIEMNKKLRDYHTMLIEELSADENCQMVRGIVVKEEMIDENEEDILEDFIIDEDIFIKNKCDEYIEDNVYDECNDNNAYYNEYYNQYNYEYDNEYNNDYKNDYDEYNGELFEKTRMPNVIPEARGMERILNNRSELTQTRDCELQSKEESIKSQIKINSSKKNEDLINIKELKVILPRNIQEQKEYIEFQRQSIERQSKKAELAEIQRSKEAEKRRANEMISRKVREAETKIINEFELERFKNDRIKIAKEIETKKLKEAELRKNIAVEETEIKGLDKRSTLMKVKEPGNYRSSSHPEVNLLKNHGVVSPVHFKKNNEHAENNTNIEQVLIESRKSPSKDNIETFDLGERGIRKCMGTEGKTSKELESKSTEVKMITRTRGLKVEEKLKESNVSKNMSTKLRPQIKSSRSSSFSASPTRVENPSTSSYEHKKQSRNTDDNSKRNTISNISYDNKNNRDINMDPIVVVRRDNLNREVIGIPRTRTRSSSFEQKIIAETKSSKQDQDNGAAIIPKETVRTKTIVSTSTHPDHQTIRSKSPPKTTSTKLTFNDGGKTLIIPVVMLTTSQIPLHKINQRSLELLKQQEIKRARDQLQKQTVMSTEVDKPPPKKRGRKHRIDVQNEKLQESNSRDKTTSQNEDESNTSIKDLEPPAKRTRRSLRNCNNDSSKK